MLRVTHIITSLGTGGTQVMLHKLIKAMDSSRFLHSVISLMDKRLNGPFIEELGVPVHTLGMNAGCLSMVALYKLVRTISILQPDIIQGWMYHGNLAAIIAQKTLKSHPLVVWNVRQALYDLKYEKRMSRIVILAGGKLSKYISCILFNSSLSASQHEKIGYPKNRSVLIPNGFDTVHYRPSEEARIKLRKEIGIGINKQLVGIVGRYHPMKDHKNFLRAALNILEHSPHVHFLLAGSGLTVENAEIGSEVYALGLSNQFHFLGHRADIPEVMCALDVFVLSSWAEAFPNVIGEAMSCGIPCVVTDVGDSARIIGSNGKVVPARDSIALSNGILELLNMDRDERRTLGMQARRRIVERFSLERIAAQYEALYEQIYAESKAQNL